MKAKDIMSTKVFSVAESRDLNFVEVVAEAKHFRHIPVIDDTGIPIGMVSISDIIFHLSKTDSSRFVPVRSIMTRTLITATPETELAKLANLMKANDVSSVLIMDHGKLVGIVTERDFLKTVS